MSLRQKLILASKSPAAEISYDNSLAQKLFLKAIETGLSSESILTEIKPLLRNINTSDEDLIFAVGQASSSDLQRSNKLHKSKVSSKGRVNMINIGSTVHEEYDEKVNEIEDSKIKKEKDTEIVRLMRGMQEQLDKLQNELTDLKATKEKSETRKAEKPKMYKCKNCIDHNKTWCDHCFVCGDDSHIARRCPTKGNEQGLRR